MDFYGSSEHREGWAGLKREPYELYGSTAPIYTSLSGYTTTPAHTDRRVPSIGEPVVSEAETFSDVLKTTYGTWDSDSSRLGIPRDPRLWSQTHVSAWLAWAIREFSLYGTQVEQFVYSLAVSGKELCSMSKEQFLARAPLFMGDILWTHLEILQKDEEKENVKMEPLTTAAQASSTPSYPSSVSSSSYQQYQPYHIPYSQYEQSWYSPTHTSTSSTYPYHLPSTPVHHTLPTGDSRDCSPNQSFSPGGQGPAFAGSGPIQLWQFLLELLTNKSCQSIICWTGDGWEFKMVDPDEVAVRWGTRKNKPKMNYEKMSRGLRYYYDKNIILKTAGKRYIYRFVCDIQSLLGYSPEEVHAMVGVPQGDKYMEDS